MPAAWPGIFRTWVRCDAIARRRAGMRRCPSEFPGSGFDLQVECAWRSAPAENPYTDPQKSVDKGRAWTQPFDTAAGEKSPRTRSDGADELGVDPDQPKAAHPPTAARPTTTTALSLFFQR